MFKLILTNHNISYTLLGSAINGALYGSRSLSELSSQSPMLIGSNPGQQQQQTMRLNEQNTNQFDNNLNFSLLSGNSAFQNSTQQALLAQQGRGPTGLSMANISPSLRDVDFTILTEDFPALPGQTAGGGMLKPDSLSGNGLQLPSPTPGSGNPSGLSMLGQDSILLQNNMNTLNGSQSVSRAISFPTHSSTIVGPGNSNNNGSNNPTNNNTAIAQFGQSLGGGLGSLTGNAFTGDTASVAGSIGSAGISGSLSKEAKYGLAGLLDVIRMTDKVSIPTTIPHTYTCMLFLCIYRM